MNRTSTFAIKHLMTNGSWAIYPARAILVVVDPKIIPSRGVCGNPMRVEFDDADSDVRSSINTGIVWVMNPNGKTVDTINLPSDDIGEAGIAA